MSIFTECKADSALLIAVLGFPKKDIVHEIKGKFEVCKRLERSTNSKGMIDEDPGHVQPVYLKTLVLADDLPQFGLQRLRDQPRRNQIIVLCPRLEEWILKAAEEAAVRVQDDGQRIHPSSLHTSWGQDVTGFLRLAGKLKGSNRVKNLKRLLSQAR